MAYMVVYHFQTVDMLEDVLHPSPKSLGQMLVRSSRNLGTKHLTESYVQGPGSDTRKTAESTFLGLLGVFALAQYHIWIARI